MARDSPGMTLKAISCKIVSSPPSRPAPFTVLPKPFTATAATPVPSAMFILPFLPSRDPRLTRTALLAAIVFALFAPLTVNAASKTLLLLGDSLSAGYGLRPEASWPALLQQRLRERGSDYNVVNLSISGETSAGGKSRLGAALAREKPALVLIALGANDGLRGLPLTQLHDNLASMIDAARASGARVLLAGMRLPPNYGPYADQFARVFADLARSRKVALLPFLLEPLATRADLFQADQLHPAAAAQGLLLEHVWATLAPLVK